MKNSLKTKFFLMASLVSDAYNSSTEIKKRNIKYKWIGRININGREMYKPRYLFLNEKSAE